MDRTEALPAGRDGGHGRPTARLPAGDGVDADVVLGRYRLRARIGSGAFGVVWSAWDERLERNVAVKAIPHDGVRDGRVEREAAAAARLGHPGIVTLYEAGADSRRSYLVSELVHGRTLGELCADRALSDRDVLRVGVALADALEHAHARGVIHRDVKPGNVIVPDHPQHPAGVAKLTDFGVARVADGQLLTRTGDVVGTLAYMAPEQAEGRPVTPAADLYALALVLYEALAGFNPVRAPGAVATARRVGAPLPPLRRQRRELPVEVAAAIDRAIDPDPARRGRIGDLRAALADALGEVSDVGRTVVGSPIEGLPYARGRALAAPPPLALRALAAGAAGVLAALALATAGPAPPLAPALGALLAFGAVALLPRLGWLAAVGAIVAWLAAPTADRPGSALLVALAAVACPLMLRRAGLTWSLPAAAPVLGALSLAGAFPALAGQARTVRHRLALGAVGFWWLALAEALAGADEYFGRAVGTRPPASFQGSLPAAVAHALLPLLRSGALAQAAVWALAAAVLPWLVRGRWLAGDLLGAAVWAAGLLGATHLVATLVDGSVVHPEPRGALLGAVVGALAAVAARAIRSRSPATSAIVGAPLPRVGERPGPTGAGVA